MNIFISWSGTTSHKVAMILREWMPSVIQSVVPYVSSENIDKGARWSTDIAEELNKSTFGILCVTKDNVEAPWLNFEAGALSKSIDKSRVCPFLFRIKRSDMSGPALQFQSTIFEKDDVFKLLKTINTSCGDQAIEEARLEKAFEVWWSPLKNDLDGIAEDASVQEVVEKKHASPTAQMEKILEEVLELSRLNQKILRSPDELLPPSYLDKLINRPNSPNIAERVSSVALDDLVFRYRYLAKKYIDFCKSDDSVIAKIAKDDIGKALRLLREPIEHIVSILDKNNGRSSRIDDLPRLPL